MIAIFYFELSNRRDQFLLVSQNSFECHCIRFVTDAFLRTWLFMDINFLEPFQVVALGLLSYLVMRAHLRKLIPGKKLFRIGLRKLRRDYWFKFMFTSIFSDFYWTVIGSFPIIKKLCINWGIHLDSFCFWLQIIF